MNIDFDVSGDSGMGRAIEELNDMEQEMQREVAWQTSAEVHDILNARIRNPTPYYETQIVVERQSSDWIVHDRGIIYGPWLEGTSERNQTTRFKGYHAFRDAEARVEGSLDQILAPILAKYMARLGG